MKHYIKLLSRDIISWLCIGSMLLIVNGYFVRVYLRNRKLVEAFGEIYQFRAASCLSIALDVVFPLFGIFLVLSYSIFRKQRRDGIFELNHLYAERKSYGCQMLLLLALDIGISINALIWVLVLYWKNCLIRGDYILHILENILVRYTLTLMVSILAGYTLALIQNKRIVFCLLVVILLLQSPMLGGINLERPVYYAILAWFRLMPFPWSDATSAIDYVDYPIVAESWWLPILWMSICLFFHICTIYPRGGGRRIGLGLNAGLFLAAVIILAYVPANLKIDPYNSYQGDNHPQYYYRFASPLPDVKEEAADFQISGYRMSFWVTDRLKGEVTVDIVEETGRDNYYFTLYHTYRVTKVWDQAGRALRFQQDGDYLDVENTGNVEAVTIQYEGSAPGCYSHKKGVLLASYFPYYPRPGYYAVFDRSEYLPIQEEAVCTFDITVYSDQQIYSNLTEVDWNHFQGEANGVFLLSGFVEELNYRGIRLLYPYDGKETESDAWKESIDLLLEFEEENAVAEQNMGVKTIMLTTTLPYERDFTYGSNWAEMAVLSPEKILQSEGYYRPDEREFILYYQFYLEHGYNEKNCVWLSIPSQ